MKSDLKCLNSQELEIGNSFDLPPECRISISASLWNKFSQFCQNLLHNLLADPQQIQVKQKVDRQGNIYWRAYDPVTGKSFASGSETDICMWIEQLYRY